MSMATRAPERSRTPVPPPIQTSLFDAAAEVGFGALRGRIVRHDVGRGAWVDLLPGWLAGADELLDTLHRDVGWVAEERQMYERIVAVPRLLCFYGEHDPLPHRSLTAARQALNEYYEPELGEPLTTAGLCLYRDGRDSVAWHGDTIGRGKTEDTIVAIISLGSARQFLLRPRGGGATIRHRLGHGDLIVMGGSCQRTWEHAVPKTARPVGPRVSIQFRPRGVR